MATQTTAAEQSAAFHGALDARGIFEILEEHGLLRETVSPDGWRHSAEALPDLGFDAVSYDTRAVTPTTLLFCKGEGFKASYLAAANDAGLTAYVSEREYADATDALGFIVTDVQKAMALLCAEFNGHPERQLTTIGITGTKGKTTTAYYVHAILSAHSGNKAAMLTSVDNCVDGEHYVESNLTTPESLDLFDLMRQAVDAGMRYLVMEVSSQAYKKNRVHGVEYDEAAFLNISPDHISPIEHPTFEDYFACKRQLLRHARHITVCADCDHLPLIVDEARRYAGEGNVALYGVRGGDTDGLDYVAFPEDGGMRFIEHQGRDGNGLRTNLGLHRLAMEGSFNDANALAAVAICRNLGVPDDSPALATVDATRVSGRMERMVSPDGIVAYIDYAHNFLSLKELEENVMARYPDPRIVVVSGSVGGKALIRRQEIAQAAQLHAAHVIFTADDPDREDPRAIAEEMRSHVTDPTVETEVIPDRAKAVEAAVLDARRHPEATNVLLVVGKGEEEWIKVDGRHAPYEGDPNVLTRMFAAASK